MNHFTKTDNKPYDKHCYRLILRTGKYVDFQDWESVHQAYFKTPESLMIEVVDKCEAAKGF